jgi:hypothetical protein
MSGRRTAIQIVAKTAMVIAALFLVSVLLAAMPGHHAPMVGSAVGSAENSGANVAANAEASPTQQDDHASVPGMKMPGDEESSEGQAVEEMSGGHHDHGLHVHMTAMRPQMPGDEDRAKEIVATLRTAMEKYKDYHVALNDGYKIFLPNIPQAEYHFTNYANGFLESLAFDPARPTSLLYKKTGTGYQLVGAMYTMPRRATEDELNARVPLSIARWHLHTNLCLPKLREASGADWSKFGLAGSIATQDACDAAGGRFHAAVFGWMTHVYPYEDSMDRIFMHGHMD